MDDLSRVTSVFRLGCRLTSCSPLNLFRGSSLTKGEQQARGKGNDPEDDANQFLRPKTCTGQMERYGEKDTGNDHHTDDDQDDP